ncbi:hypothetical protein [Roseomonas indoligenes]|uniref:Uncharacterized protein n=1 Tax=Roseomonas indoligenes TaxID=2820811 RepID=A0A940S465_9PROT|nr:hypothetical protein [Pararoseomonas indoligenes]MBP0491680.1 hypothetical protein [Pararoseomonas indoligenes]
MNPLTPEELHRAIRKVVADYEAFVARGPAPGTHEDPKAFTAHHAAARSALAHLEHLMKLDKGQVEPDAVAETGALIAEARRSIQLAEQEEGEERPEDDDAA